MKLADEVIFFSCGKLFCKLFQTLSKIISIFPCKHLKVLEVSFERYDRSSQILLKNCLLSLGNAQNRLEQFELVHP